MGVRIKKQPGTLADWDRLQEALADVMGRVYSCRMKIERADPKILETETERLKDLEAEELRIRNEIATLSRAIRVELEGRDD